MKEISIKLASMNQSRGRSISKDQIFPSVSRANLPPINFGILKIKRDTFNVSLDPLWVIYLWVIYKELCINEDR